MEYINLEFSNKLEINFSYLLRLKFIISIVLFHDWILSFISWIQQLSLHLE